MNSRRASRRRGSKNARTSRLLELRNHSDRRHPSSPHQVALVSSRLHLGKGQWRLADKADQDEFALYVTDCNGVRQLLQRLDTHEAKCTLGVWFAPSGAATEIRARK
jgi:hypothetical protein